MTKMRMKKIFQDFVSAACDEFDPEVVMDIIVSVADEYEIKELGLGWLTDEEEPDEDYF